MTPEQKNRIAKDCAETIAILVQEHSIDIFGINRLRCLCEDLSTWLRRPHCAKPNECVERYFPEPEKEEPCLVKEIVESNRLQG